MKRKLDISFVLGVFTSSILVWIYLYQLIIETTTDSPTDLSLFYLGLAHYVSFLSVLFSFVLLFRYGMQQALKASDTAQLVRFNKLTDIFQQMGFVFWAPMVVLSVSAIFFSEAFATADGGSLNDTVGLIVGALFCLGFFVFFLKFNLFDFFKKMPWQSPSVLLIGFFAYIFIMACSAVGVKVTVEKPFYKNDEVVRFQVLRKGYIFLPHVNHVKFNFIDTIKPTLDYSYFINLKKYPNLNQAVIQVEYESQGLATVKRKYVYLGVTPE